MMPEHEIKSLIEHGEDIGIGEDEVMEIIDTRCGCEMCLEARGQLERKAFQTAKPESPSGNPQTMTKGDSHDKEYHSENPSPEERIHTTGGTDASRRGASLSTNRTMRTIHGAGTISSKPRRLRIN